MLNISAKRYNFLEIVENRLKAWDQNGNVRVYSLKGITGLNCSGNELETLPELPETIAELICSFNEIKNLPRLPKSLKILDCCHNHLETLPDLPDTLEELVCDNNELKSLPTLPEYLQDIRVGENYSLCSLPELPKNLIGLNCMCIRLHILPNLPDTLEHLVCSYNRLHTLPKLPKTLTELYCYDNPLTFIAPLPTRPKSYHVPENFRQLHSREHYPIYRKRYETYLYLISFLTLQHNLLPSLFLNEAWWFPGLTQA